MQQNILSNTLGCHFVFMPHINKTTKLNPKPVRVSVAKYINIFINNSPINLMNVNLFSFK